MKRVRGDLGEGLWHRCGVHEDSGKKGTQNKKKYSSRRIMYVWSKGMWIKKQMGPLRPEGTYCHITKN